MHQAISALYVATALAISCQFASAAEPPADLVVLDATILTMDHDIPAAEALAVRGDKIVAIGSSEAIRPLVGPQTQVLRLRGKAITPGFNDAHIHPSPLYAEDSLRNSVPCGPGAVANINELVAALRARAERTPVGEWVRGSRYEDTKLGRHLTRDDLDRVSTSHPVYVSHSSGHVAAVNSMALDLASITADTPDPKGGSYDRDADGRPTGVLRESAKGRVLDAGPSTPSVSTDEWIEGIARRFDEYAQQGITSIQHAGTSPSTVRKYALAQEQKKSIRIYVMLRRGYLDELTEMVAERGRGDEWLRVGAIKTFHGNSLSGQTCWLYEPYAGRPNYYGIPPAVSQKTLNQRVLAIHRAGMQACIHANGDREIDMVLNAYEAALEKEPRPGHRHRIEHASICNQQILDRVKRLGVVLAPHSYVWEHGDKMEAYGPKRWDWMHANGSAMAMDIPVAGNSDSPVSAAKPLLRIQSMVTRTSAEGKTYGPQQQVTVEQAIYAWTMGSAYAAHEEEIKGSLTPGKLADFVVLSSDPRAVEPSTIKDIVVETTVVGGNIVFNRNTAGNDVSTGRPKVELAPGQRLVGKLAKGPATENSGIVRSRNHKNVFWMHNDSGDEPRIYAVRRNGTTLRAVRYGETPGTLIGGAINVDWEDIATMHDGSIVVADVGNNSNARRDLVLYLLNEPEPTAGRTTYFKKLFVRYPEQKSFPAPRRDFNYDCESIFTLGEHIYFLTKHRSDTATRVYRLGDFTEGKIHDLELVDRFELGGQAVGADALPDGSRIVVTTYDTLWLFDVRDQRHPLAHPIGRLPFKADQVEAVCFDGPNHVLFADEATALLYSAHVEDFLPIENE